MTNADQTIYVAQGEFQTSHLPNIVFSTVLGSCVSACIWDPDIGVGGMNHFLLAKSSDSDEARSLRYGVHAMEMLINDLLKKLFRAAARLCAVVTACAMLHPKGSCRSLIGGSDPVKKRGTWVDAHLRVVTPLLR